MLDAAVLLHGRRIGQHHRILQGLQSVHQPVPIVSGLHCHLLQPLFEWSQKLCYLFELAGQFAARHSLAVCIHDADHNVIAMQIDSCHYFLHWSPFSFSVVVVVTTTERQLFYCEATASSTALNVYQSCILPVLAEKVRTDPDAVTDPLHILFIHSAN